MKEISLSLMFILCAWSGFENSFGQPSRARGLLLVAIYVGILYLVVYS